MHDRDRVDKIQRILVPIDFGPVTDSAVAWALLFAQRFSAEVHIRGLAATLRNRMSIPLLSIRQATGDSPHAASGTAAR